MPHPAGRRGRHGVRRAACRHRSATGDADARPGADPFSRFVTAFSLALKALVAGGRVAVDTQRADNSITGHSGGGKSMIGHNESTVLPEGRIKRQVGDERQKFADATGAIVVEIDNEYLPRETFDWSARLRIKGEVDRRGHPVSVIST